MHDGIDPAVAASADRSLRTGTRTICTHHRPYRTFVESFFFPCSILWSGFSFPSATFGRSALAASDESGPFRRALGVSAACSAPFGFMIAVFRRALSDLCQLTVPRAAVGGGDGWVGVGAMWSVGAHAVSGR